MSCDIWIFKPKKDVSIEWIDEFLASDEFLESFEDDD